MESIHPVEEILGNLPIFNSEKIELLFERIPILRTAYQNIVRQFFKYLPHKGGMKVLKPDWDYLIVLDDCKFDYFKKKIKGRLEGDLKTKISLGSTTREWLNKNFNQNHPEIVYVSGNPFISEPKLVKDIGFVPFHHIENVWDYGWSDELKTVPPENVTNATLDVIDKFPEKKFIIHYMQPHGPFIGECYREGSSETEGWNKEKYSKNLEIVLEEVERLVQYLNGSIVITSDHGECFGEYHFIGHPINTYIRPLLEVPWMEITN